VHRGWCLTIHSSRSRFAARLNSGVSHHYRAPSESIEMPNHLRAAISIVVAAASSYAWAESPKASYAHYVVMQSCPQMVAPALSDSKFTQAIRTRPINIENVCSCAADATLRDESLREFATASQEQTLLRMRDEKLKSYYLLRALQATMTCTASELDLSLDSARPAGGSQGGG